MARKRSGQSIGEMISSVSFFGLGVYATLYGFAFYEADLIGKAVLSWIAAFSLLLASIRFMAADWIEALLRLRR
jgi:hypothetical protein